MNARRTGNGASRGNASKSRYRRGNVGGLLEEVDRESLPPGGGLPVSEPPTEPTDPIENSGSRSACVAPADEPFALSPSVHPERTAEAETAAPEVVHPEPLLAREEASERPSSPEGTEATEESKPYGWVDEAPNPLPGRRKLSRSTSILAAAACFAALVVTARVATRPHTTTKEVLPSSGAMVGAAAQALEVPPPPDVVAPADTRVEDLPAAPAAPPVHAAKARTETKLPTLPAIPQLAAAPPPEPLPAPPPPRPAAAEPQVVVVEQTTAAPTSLSSPRMSIGSTVRGFDPVAAHGALDAINPTSCWAAGAAHGYGRARVTFGTGGTVQLVQITNPVQGASPDKECIARKYTSATVPPFHGTDVTAYTTFFVN